MTFMDPMKAMHSYYYFNNKKNKMIRHRVNGQTEIWVFDPHLCMDIFRQEGMYPQGMTTSIWPMTLYCKRKGKSLGINGSGPEWKQIRQILQPDMLPPKVAATYIPLL